MKKNKDLEIVLQKTDDTGNGNRLRAKATAPKLSREMHKLKRKYAMELEDIGLTDLPEPEELGFIPIYPKFDLNVSGFYSYTSPRFKQTKPLRIKTETDNMIESLNPITPLPIKPVFPPLNFYSEELRLDVDGRYPLMVASGKIINLISNVHWIANLTKVSANVWEGEIWYKRGSINFFKYTNVKIETVRSIFIANRSAKVTFTGKGLTDRVITLKFQSTYAHNVEFEFDYEEGVTPVTSIQTFAHPNHPTTITNESLSVDTVFRRCGFNVTHTAGAGAIPSSLKGSNGKWSDNEMHDAMQSYWSKFSNIAQWSLWTFFAKQHDQGSTLGGIMFDDIGPNHRQGTAVFYNSFIANAPSYDTNKPAWVNRMMFWTVVHEMGHAFNLAHSWQKEYPYLGNPWIPSLADEPEARSFMNYPYNVSGGESNFFSDFEYRFSDQELLFMRHAPAEFVQMGNANWFDNHAFEWAKKSRQPVLQLEARVHRQKNEFDFMEPVNIELKLKNISTLPEVVDSTILKDLHEMTIVIKRNDDPAKLYFPFTARCYLADKKVLQPGESLYESVFLSAGKKGWIISEPGYYCIQLCIHRKDEDIVSNPLMIRINPPRNYNESYVAQDFFSDDVSRIIAFNGSMVLDKGNEVLQEVSEKLKGSKVANHANILIATPLSMDYKLIDFTAIDKKNITSVADSNGKIKTVRARSKDANKYFEKTINKSAGDEKAVVKSMDEVVETIGHIDSRKVVDDYTKSLLDEGKRKDAVQVQENLLKVYENRGVIKHVREEIKNKIKDLRR
jgi:hypothetical protein